MNNTSIHLMNGQLYKMLMKKGWLFFNQQNDKQ